jgi:hypothetical protein
VVSLSDSSLTPGNLTQVIFSFGAAGNVTITAQIQSNTGLFAAYNPDAVSGVSDAGASPSASTSAGVSTSPSASPSATASASASASPSPSAS